MTFIVNRLRCNEGSPVFVGDVVVGLGYRSSPEAPRKPEAEQANQRYRGIDSFIWLAEHSMLVLRARLMSLDPSNSLAAAPVGVGKLTARVGSATLGIALAAFSSSLISRARK